MDARTKRSRENGFQERKNKKGISEKRSPAVHPPRISVSENRFPPKTAFGPLDGDPNAGKQQSFILSGNSPDSVIPGQDRLCRRGDRSPLRNYYITVLQPKQTGKPARKPEKPCRTALFPRWSNLLVKILEQAGNGGRKKPHPGRTTDAAG